jgi:hypothetical protein
VKCEYVGKNGIVVIINFPGGSAAKFDNLIASRARLRNAEPLAGVGDKAVLGEPPREGIKSKSVLVLKGDVVLGVSVTRESPPVTADEMKELTAKVVSRLP